TLVNDEAVKNPAILNIDPFGEGWLAEISLMTLTKSIH
ncbi:MAG: hypothetical protein IJM47_09930, partial [Synergistaceae bacterium]|nr:hypothetical protein [Synergistaceae bacterium]